MFRSHLNKLGAHTPNTVRLVRRKHLDAHARLSVLVVHDVGHKLSALFAHFETHLNLTSCCIHRLTAARLLAVAPLCKHNRLRRVVVVPQKCLGVKVSAGAAALNGRLGAGAITETTT